MFHETLDFRVEDGSQTAEVRRAAIQLAEDLGHDETAAERVAIVVTELCTNLLKHAGGGRLLVSDATGDESGGETVQVLAVDNGPGMRDIPECFRDGYTTSTSPGNGLGAVGRLSSTVDVYSVPGQGTGLLARVGRNGKNDREKRTAKTGLSTGVVRVRKPGQDVCGDDWILTVDYPRHTVVVADGLGHGYDAAKASGEAVRVASKYNALRPKDLVDIIHTSLRSTRGAAIGVAQIDVDRGTIAFSGAGNIAACVVPSGDRAQHLVSVNGTAGHEIRRLQEYSYPWTGDGVLLMHSDGLSARWNLSAYPGLLAHDPALIAGILYRDHCRHTDDATVVAVRAASQHNS